MTVRAIFACLVVSRGIAIAGPPATAATCDGHDVDVLVSNTTLVPGHTVLEGGDPRHPGIVLFHELPGLTHHDRMLGARLVCEGFHVYMPLMFGDVDQSNTALGRRQACDPGANGHPRFWCSNGAGEHPILGDWLRDAVKTIGADHRPIAVIGMCLTGTFALSLAHAANVTVAVLAQPTLPFGFLKAADLDVPQDTLKIAIRDLADRQAGVFLVRARFDVISTSDKVERLRVALRRAAPDGLRDVYIRQVAGFRHSVLTVAAPKGDSPVMRDLLAMLRRHL